MVQCTRREVSKMYESLKEKILIQMELEKTIYDKLNEEGKNPELDAYFKGLRTAYNLVLEMIESEEK